MKVLNKTPLWVAAATMAILLAAFGWSTSQHNLSVKADHTTVTRLNTVVQAIFAYSAEHGYVYPASVPGPELRISQADLPDGFSYTTGSYKGYAYADYPMFTICATFRAQAVVQQTGDLLDDTGNDIYGIGVTHPKGKQCYTGTHDAKGDALRPSAQ